MYAVVVTGGKQYRVSVGDTLQVEKLAGESGNKIMLDQVLLVGSEKELKIGTPMIEGAKVEAEVVRQARGKKIVISKKKRRKGYRKTQGHRQFLTELKITKIFS